ncbi:MAG: hypothetical protein MJ236_01185 [Clostridia bacterium]|nr:hypothetical protein [Clostridia bacterium]
MSASIKKLILTICGLAAAIAPPFIATILQFPTWTEEPKATISGVAILLIFFSCLPFWNQIKAYFKGSPSVTLLWIIVFVLLMLLKNIINEMLYVCVAGLAGNMVSEIFFMIRKNIKDELKEEE